MFSPFWSANYVSAIILLLVTITNAHVAAIVPVNNDVGVKSRHTALTGKERQRDRFTTDVSRIYWPPESPFPVTRYPSTTSTNTTIRASLPQCNGASYGRNLHLASCMQVYESMSAYSGTRSFGRRGTGYYEAPLPFRYLSHDGRCAVDVSAARGVTESVVSPIDLKNAALVIIQICVATKPNQGGLVTGLGENGGLVMRVVPYRPTVACGPDGSGPPW